MFVSTLLMVRRRIGGVVEGVVYMRELEARGTERHVV